MIQLTKKELRERKHFDTFADRYDFNYQYSKPFTQYKIDKKSKEFARLVKKYIKKESPKILEIGCGTGEYTKRMAKNLPKANIVGLDISKNVLEIAKDKCKNARNVSFTQKSIYNNSFKKDSFDVICGFYVLHHLEMSKIVKEVFRILKEGGVIFFYEPNILNPIVFLIKKTKFLKKMVGDSPDEWAINPLKVKKQFGNQFEIIQVKQTEFVWPLHFFKLKTLILLDKITHDFQKIPIINYLGGSVQICLRKKKQNY
jgi:ubiquinone/menaquinone biosynthesis C-methylase UbiE